jgi:hypothetical protein
MKISIIAIVWLYGTSSTGSGWLAQEAKGGRTIGTGTPQPGRSFTEAVFTAVQDLTEAHPEVMGRKGGLVRVFAPGGEFCADVPAHAVPTYGEMPWKEAPVLVISAEKLAALED